MVLDRTGQLVCYVRIGRDGLTSQHDFEFLHGLWRVDHRRLKNRLIGNSEWEEFSGTTHVRPILGGLGNIDENVISLPQGQYDACTIRLFSPEAGLWSIHWIDGRDPKLDPPMVGKFVDGVGTFLGSDQYNHHPINVRFIWSDITTTSARWEQAFSVDCGASYEINWIMNFERQP